MQWFLVTIAVLASLVATMALLKARRLAKRLERLSESYWELRYEQGQLGARVGRLEGTVPSASNAPQPPGTAAFVPLTALKGQRR